MSSAPPSDLTGAIVLLAVVVLFLARRAYAMATGVRYSLARMWVFAGFYILLFAVLALGTLYGAVVTWGPDAYGLIAAYVGLPAAAAGVAAPYVRRVVRFERWANGEWYYRLGWQIPALYLALFVARLVAEVVVLGPSAIVVAFPPPVPSTTDALLILLGVDLLFSVSTGLLIGRGVGVYRAHRDLQSDGSPVPSPPLPSG